MILTGANNLSSPFRDQNGASIPQPSASGTRPPGFMRFPSYNEQSLINTPAIDNASETSFEYRTWIQFCVLFFFTSCNLIACAIIIGFGWKVLNSSEICFDGNYVKTVTISSTIFVGIYWVIFILSVIRYLIQNPRPSLCQKIITQIVIIVLLVSMILDLAWFLWGIGTLSQRECSSDTNHWKFSLGVVIYFGIIFVSSSCLTNHIIIFA
jgi:hypothetical protein